MINTWTTRDDAIRHGIVEPIEATGEVKALDFDVEALADELVARVLIDGRQLYAIWADHDAFWDAVERHACDRGDLLDLLDEYVTEHADSIGHVSDGETARLRTDAALARDLLTLDKMLDELGAAVPWDRLDSWPAARDFVTRTATAVRARRS